MNKLACNPSGMIRRSSRASIARREDDQGKVCILCGKTDIYMSQYGNWGALEKAYIVQHLSETPSDESWICKKHHLEAQRHHSTPNFIPKWKGQRSQKPVTKCLNPKCQTSQYEKLIKPAFAPIDKLKLTIGISTTDPLVLCQKCYNDLYQLFHPSTICHSCGATPKAGTSFCRHSYDALTVSQHLSDTTGCDVSIHPDDYLCYNCYKLHTSILKSLESQLQEPDYMLCSLTEIWRAKASDKDTDRLTVAVVKAALFVAEQLLQQKAVLLPQASQVFLQAYGVNHTGSIKSVELNLEVGEVFV